MRSRPGNFELLSFNIRFSISVLLKDGLSSVFGGFMVSVLTFVCHSVSCCSVLSGIMSWCCVTMTSSQFVV